MKNIAYYIASLSFIALLFLTACQTVPEEIPEGLSKQEYFQRAQDYLDNGNRSAALFYLDGFKEQFSDDLATIQAANYQIGLIYYKAKQYDTAQSYFMDIIEVYENDETGELLEWVEVLTDKLLAKIDEQTNKSSSESNEENQ